MQAVELHIALVTKLDHEMLVAVLHMGILSSLRDAPSRKLQGAVLCLLTTSQLSGISENHLLLPHAASETTISSSTSQEGPGTLFGHEVDDLERAKSCGGL